MSNRDPADRVLAAAVRLLPRGRQEWGRAMRAELAGIGPRGERWRFVLGCARVVATRLAVLRDAAYNVSLAGLLVVTFVWSRAVTSAPVRWGLVTIVSILVTLSWLGRRAPFVGPVAASWGARTVRAFGHVLVGTMAFGLVTALAVKDNAAEGVPIIGIVLGSYLLGFLAVTSRGSAATGAALATGAGAGVTAAAVWTVVVLAFPPLPAFAGLAFVSVVAAIVATALLNQPQGALLAGTVAAVLIVIVLVVLSSVAPPSMIPDLAPAALTPADDLEQSRSELQDPYVAVFVIGALLALTAGVASVLTRRSDHRVAAPVA